MTSHWFLGLSDVEKLYITTTKIVPREGKPSWRAIWDFIRPEKARVEHLWDAHVSRPHVLRTGLWGPLRMWALAPSQAEARAERGGVPSRSVIRSNWNRRQLIWRWGLFYLITMNQRIHAEGTRREYTDRMEFVSRYHLGISEIIYFDLTCWMGLWAWKRMRRPSSSAKMQPTDQTSMAEL